MSSNELTIAIRAKNLMAAGIKAATADMHILGKKGDEIAGRMIGGFAKIAGAAIAVGAAAVSAGTIALKAYSESQAAEEGLAAAIASRGGSIDALLPRYKALASAIQDQTALDDEATLGIIKYLTNIGVSADKMEQATKGALGLSKALGMDQESAAKAAAQALEGNYSALQRYIPALKTATTDAEKQALVQQVMTAGYAQQAAGLNTLQGRYNEVKGRAGDFLEVIGKVINDNVQVQDGMAAVSAWIKQASADFEEFAQDGRLDALVMQVKLFGSDFMTTMQNIWAYSKAVWNTIDDTIGNTFRYAGDVIGKWVNAAIESFKYLTDFYGEVKRKLEHPIEYNFTMPNSAGMTDAMGQYWGTLLRPDKKFQNTNIVEGFQTATAQAEANTAAQAKRDAEIKASADRAAQERADKQVARQKEIQATATVGAVADVQEQADEQTVAAAGEIKAVQAEDISQVEQDLDKARLDDNLQRELEHVDVVAKAKAAANSEVGLGGDPAALEFAKSGQAVTPESLSRNGIIGTERAIQLEAERVRAIVEAVNAASASGPQVDLLKVIADNTGRTAAALPGALVLR